jgi:Acetyltransferase (GNAT) family
VGIRVRKSDIQDLPFIIGELRKFSDFFPSQIPVYPSEEYARHIMTVMIESHVVLVAENETGPVGFIAGILGSHLYNPTIKTLTETFWWVTPEHRNSRAASILLDEFISLGKTLACWINFSLNTKTAVNDKTLTKRGFKPLERNFLMEVI